MSTTPDTVPSANASAMAAMLRQLVDDGHADQALRQVDPLTETEIRQAPELELEVARALARVGRFGPANARATSALQGFRAARDVRGQMRANLTLGGIALERGLIRDAETKFGVVRVLALALGDRRVVSQVTNNLACLALQRQDFPAAEGLLESSLQMAAELADLRAQAEILHNLNLVRRGAGNYDGARSAGTEALALAEQLGDWSMVALALSGLAETASWAGNTQDKALLDRAEASAKQVNDPIRQAEIGRVRAVFALTEGSYAEARRLAQSARTLAESQGSELLVGECNGIEAIALKREGQMQAAWALMERASSALAKCNAFLEAAWLDREWAMAA